MHEIKNKVMLDPDGPLMKAKFNPEDGSVEASDYADIYMFKCSKALVSIDSSIQNARLSLSLLNSTALDSIVSSNEDKSKLIQLWVENSIIRVQSIYDRALILVNRFFDLGLADETISHQTIVCNEHVKRYGVDTLMKAINKKCKEYRLVRNSVIHHDRYTEESLDNITLFLQASHLSIENGGEPLLEQKFLDRIVKEYLDTKNEELTVYVNEIESKVNDLYTRLIPIYEAKKVGGLPNTY